MADPILNLLNGHRKMVIIGEAGSGKTEMALNLAAQIHCTTRQDVSFFDMDQTKPLYRATNVADELRRQGIRFDVTPENGDTPALPSGVTKSLYASSEWTILDVGGSQAGALCMGQFAPAIRDTSAAVFYLINSYRSFSDTTAHIQATMAAILACCGLPQVQIISNPFLGDGTTAEEFHHGQAVLSALLEPIGFSISGALVPQQLWDEVAPALDMPALPIQPFMKHVLALSPPTA